MTKVLGLTGGIASGKSTVSQMLSAAGLPIIDADQVVRKLQQPGTPGLKLLRQAFGNGIVTNKGVLNRQALGQQVFDNDQQLTKLNQIMQPLVWDEIWRQVELFRQTKAPWVVLDVPLLIENHYDRDCDLVVVVAVDHDIQRQRLMKRNHLSLDQAEARIAAQMPLEEKKQVADVVINNNGDLKTLRSQVEDLVNHLKTGKMW